MKLTLRVSPRQRDNEKFSRFDTVGPQYFATVGIPLLLGRDIGQQDALNAPRVCVINEAFAKLSFKDRNPIGRHVTEKFGDKKSVMEDCWRGKKCARPSPAR